MATPAPSTEIPLLSIRPGEFTYRKHRAVDSCSSAQPTFPEEALIPEPIPGEQSEFTTHILDIPDEVLALTFNFLGPSDVANTIACCKTFQRIVDDNYWEPRAKQKWNHCLIERYGFDWKALYKDNNRESYTGEYLWRVPNFSKREEKKILSPIFKIGGYPWHVLLFPSGNHDSNCVAFYLKPADEMAEYPMRKAAINFTVKNQKDERKSRSRKCEHFFDRGEPDWGFTSFMRFSELKAPEAGFLENDEFVLLTELLVTPFREAHDLDPDDEDAVERVAREIGCSRQAARKAYIDSRQNENQHDLKKSESKALKLLRTNLAKYEAPDDAPSQKPTPVTEKSVEVDADTTDSDTADEE